jgi:glutathione peroxidase
MQEQQAMDETRDTPASKPIYEIPVRTLDGRELTLAEYAGKVLLIVNTASQCGFTPQYAGLEQLYKDYAARGFVVLGFPCNQFGAQEPGDDGEIAAFCEKNYGVSFPMFAKIEVNGDNAHPLFKWLKSSARGLLGTEAIKWNFTKFLVDRNGVVVDRYASTSTPASIASDIESLLGA